MYYASVGTIAVFPVWLGFSPRLDAAETPVEQAEHGSKYAGGGRQT